jgi:hypothetical protein
MGNPFDLLGQSTAGEGWTSLRGTVSPAARALSIQTGDLAVREPFGPTVF